MLEDSILQLADIYWAINMQAWSDTVCAAVRGMHWTKEMVDDYGDFWVSIVRCIMLLNVDTEGAVLQDGLGWKQ